MEKEKNTSQLELQMEKTPKLDMRKCRTNSSFKLVVSEKLEGKIRYLCDKFPNTEWSGIMFYSEQDGNLEDKDLVLVAEDFYLLDVGTAGYTEYEVTPDVLAYQIDNDLLDCWWSLIHSHNNFSAYFSGTDLNTLNKIGETINHCVSLIVNNAGQYVARITRIVDESYECKANGIYNSFDNVKREFEYNFGGNKKSLEYIDANIEIQEPLELTEEGKEFLEKRIEEIDAAKKAAKSIVTEKYVGWFGDEFEERGYAFDDVEVHESTTKKDIRNYKSFIYSLITGDLFPLGCVVNRSTDSVVSDALKIYNVKKRAIKNIANNDIYFDNYVYAIMNYYINDFDEAQGNDMIRYAADVFFDHAAKGEWINKLYQTLLMYEY